MINLSDAKIGDLYKLKNNNESTVIFATNDAVILDFEGVTIMVDKGGETLHANSGLSVVSKIDTRPWLKDMPDAGIFADEVKWFACDADGYWYAYKEEPGLNASVWGEVGFFSSLRVVKMPILPGDKWKDSKISIEGLREWQEANK